MILPPELAERVETEAAGQALSDSAYLRMVIYTLAARSEQHSLLLLAQQGTVERTDPVPIPRVDSDARG